jgi:16S rRNA G1207 methylase RsmC
MEHSAYYTLLTGYIQSVFVGSDIIKDRLVVSMEHDVYFKKTISLDYMRQHVEFNVSQSLFSSFKIDTGTVQLLKSLRSHSPFKKVLDLGCGYGPLGISLAVVGLGEAIQMVDRDALAVYYAQQNAALHSVSARAYASLDFDGVTDQDFDLIVSNIPAKVGVKALSYLLLAGQHYLSSRGIIAIVVVVELDTDVQGILSDPSIEILERSESSGHVVYHYRFRMGGGAHPPINGFEHGVYDREEIEIEWKGKVVQLSTVRGVDEFDSLSAERLLELKLLHRVPKSAFSRSLYSEPNQGVIPVLMQSFFPTSGSTVVSRDLLSIRATQRNLERNGFLLNATSFLHVPSVFISTDALFAFASVHLLDSEERRVHEEVMVKIMSLVEIDGFVVVSGSSTNLTRSADFIKDRRAMRLVERLRDNARSAALFQKNA